MKDVLLNTKQAASLIRENTGLMTHHLTVGKLVRLRKLRAINISSGDIRPRYRIYKKDVLEYIKMLKKEV